MSADELLALARAYCEARHITLSTAGTYAARNERIFTRLAAGKGCNSRSIDRAAQWFSANWPDDLAWPAGIPRPESPSEDAA
jgi:hypothetical protein